MPLSHDERASVAGWPSFLAAARRHATALQVSGHDVPDLSDSVPLQSLSTWLESLSALNDSTRRSFHELVNSVAGMQRVLALANVHGCPGADASLDMWAAAVSDLSRRFPLRETQEQGPDDAPRDLRRPARVLCIEDDENWQFQLRQVAHVAMPWLPPESLCIVSTADEATEFIAAHSGEDVVTILDLGIPQSAGATPDRFQGLQLLQLIRDRAPHWPVIVWSVPFDSIEDHRAAISYGIADYLLKTGPASELGAAVRRVLAQEPYRIGFPDRGATIVLDSRLCTVSPQQHEILWEMAVDREWRTAAEWEHRLKLGDNGFHAFLNDLHARLTDELKAHHTFFDWPRLVASRPREGDAEDDTREYKLFAHWDTRLPDNSEARRAFRVLPPGAESRRSRLRRLRVLVVDDKELWRQRVVSTLAAATYDVRSAHFGEGVPVGFVPDVICLDMIDLADPSDAEPAGFRWLRANTHIMDAARVIVLSSVGHHDSVRTRLSQEFGVRPYDVVLKDERDDESPDGSYGNEWRFHLLRSLFQVERDRIIGVGMTALVSQGWPATFQRVGDQWEIVTGNRRSPVFVAALNRRRLLERLAMRPFLPVHWKALNDAIYGDTEAPVAGSPAGRNRLALLVTNCRREFQALAKAGTIYPIDTTNLIQFADDGYVLNARVVTSPPA